MIVKYEKWNLLNIILFFIYLVCYFFVLINFEMGTTISNIRYYLLVVISLYAFFCLICKHPDFKIKYGKKNLFYVILLSVVFLIMSYYKAKAVNMSLANRTYIQISLILLPAFFAFDVVNLYSTKTIVNLMKLTLFITIIFYFTEPKHNIIQFFNISNWANISLASSSSFTESSVCAEVFLQLFLFFLYFADIDNDGKKNKKYIFLSLIFTILSFKRLGLVFAFGMCIVKRFVDIRAKISSKFIIVFSVIFTLITYFYNKFMLGEIFQDVDIYKFTTGRNYIMHLWKQKNYFSYGYGTSMLVINRYLEMDLIEINMELNLFAVFMYIYVMFKLANKNLYSFMIMFYVLVNMITASSLPHSLGWILVYITINCISSEKISDEKIEINMKKRKFKKIFQIEEREKKDE